MPCCCVKTLNLCRVPVCGILELDQVATAPMSSGVENIYTLVLDFLDTTVTILAAQIEGQNIKFDIGDLNENFEYTGQIYDADGAKVSIEVGDESYDCIKFKTIISINAVSGTAIPPVLDIPGTVVIEAVIGGDPVVTGTDEEVTGLVVDSNTVTCDAFANVRVVVTRGNVPLPGINPLDGSNYFTKALASNYITFNFTLIEGEFIRIQTIPA